MHGHKLTSSNTKALILSTKKHLKIQMLVLASSLTKKRISKSVFEMIFRRARYLSAARRDCCRVNLATTLGRPPLIIPYASLPCLLPLLLTALIKDKALTVLTAAILWILWQFRLFLFSNSCFERLRDNIVNDFKRSAVLRIIRTARGSKLEGF